MYSNKEITGNESCCCGLTKAFGAQATQIFDGKFASLPIRGLVLIRFIFDLSQSPCPGLRNSVRLCHSEIFRWEKAAGKIGLNPLVLGTFPALT